MTERCEKSKNTWKKPVHTILIRIREEAVLTSCKSQGQISSPWSNANGCMTEDQGCFICEIIGTS